MWHHVDQLICHAVYTFLDLKTRRRSSHPLSSSHTPIHTLPMMTLPHHVLLHIFHALANQGDYKTTVSLSQTCQSIRETYTATFQKLAKHDHALHRISDAIRLSIEREPPDSFIKPDPCINISFNAHKIRLKVVHRSGMQVETYKWVMLPEQQNALMELHCDVEEPSSLCLKDFVELAHALRPATQNQPMLKATRGGQEVYVPCGFSICAVGTDFCLTEHLSYGPVPTNLRVFQLYAVIKTSISEEHIPTTIQRLLGPVSSQYIACI